MTQLFRRVARPTALAAAMAFAGVAFIGCEEKEKVLDVKTPNKSIEIERSKDTGNIDVEVESRRSGGIEVETPRIKVKVERSKGNGLPRVDVHTDRAP